MLVQNTEKPDKRCGSLASRKLQSQGVTVKTGGICLPAPVFSAYMLVCKFKHKKFHMILANLFAKLSHVYSWQKY